MEPPWKCLTLRTSTAIQNILKPLEYRVLEPLGTVQNLKESNLCEIWFLYFC